MKRIINQLLELVSSNELLQVELVALGVILLLLLLRLFEFRIRHISYVSVIILISFPILWFTGKGIFSLFRRINIPEETWAWIWASLGIMVLLILMFIFSKKMPKLKWKNWLWIPIILPVICSSVFIKFKLQQSNDMNRYGRHRLDISSYKELKIGKPSSFEANVWKKFKFSPSNTKEQKYLNFYLKSSKDTVTLTFKQVSNGREWSWEHWIDQGKPRFKLVDGYLEAFTGDCLVKADKGCSFNCLIE